VTNSNRKIALVTGMSKGIGKAIARQLIADGFTIYGTYNTGVNAAEALKKDLKHIEIFQVDLSQRSCTLELIERLRETKFDAIINNAGVFQPENLDDFNFELWDATFEINLNAPVLLSIKLKDNISNGGTIVNIASTDAFIGSFNSIAYAASKAALISITKSLAITLGPRQIRVVGIAPGWISNTGMNTSISQEAAQLAPLERNGTAEEIAQLVSFLVSGKASFITGTTIIADGGYTCVDSIMKKEASL
jgi:3-oxoacyl-[acyl-carrier protein] reductase